MTFAPGRHAFTAIEIMVVVSVLTILAAMSSVAVTATVRHTAVVNASDAVLRAGAIARDRAIRSHSLNSIPEERDADHASKRYGLVISDATDGQPARVMVTWGATALPGEVLRDRDGEASYATDLSRTVCIFRQTESGDLERLNGSIGWMYQHSTGLATNAAVLGAPMAAIGTDAQLGPLAHHAEIIRIAERLVLANADGTHAVSLRLLVTGQILAAKD